MDILRRLLHTRKTISTSASSTHQVWGLIAETAADNREKRKTEGERERLTHIDNAREQQ